MSPKTMLENLTPLQKIITTLGSTAGVVIVVGMFLHFQADRRDGPGPLVAGIEAALQAHASESAKTDTEQVALLKRLITLEEENVKASERSAFLLRLICEDQVDERVKKFCQR